MFLLNLIRSGPEYRPGVGPEQKASQKFVNYWKVTLAAHGYLGVVHVHGDGGLRVVEPHHVDGGPGVVDIHHGDGGKGVVDLSVGGL